MTKISTFMVGLVLSSLFVTIIAVFMANLSTSYNLEYDNETFATYQQLDKMANNTYNVKRQVESIKERSGILDVIESMFNDGYQALMLTGQSFSTFETMGNSAIDQLNLGVSGQYIKIAMFTVVLILIFIGVFIRMIVKATEL